MKSKASIRKACLVFALACIALSPYVTARAAEAEAEIGVFSAYVWRGLVVNDEPVLQPSLSVAAGGFNINVWGNFDLTDQDGAFDSMQFSEVDLTASRAWEMGDITFETGLVNYMFPNLPSTDSDTTELFFGIGFDVLLEPSLTVSYDVDAIDGIYALLELGHTFEFGEKTELALSAACGYGDSSYNEGYFEVGDAGPIDLTLGIAVDHALNDTVGIGAGVSRMQILDSAIEESVGNRDTETVASVSLSFAW